MLEQSINEYKLKKKNTFVLYDLKQTRINAYNMLAIVRLRNMDQAQTTGEHRIYAQTCTCTNSSFEFFSSLFLIIFPLFFNPTYPVNSIAKDIFWAEIYRGRLFLGPRYIGDDYFQGRDISGTTFFRADHFLGAKQEGLTIVHF